MHLPGCCRSRLLSSIIYHLQLAQGGSAGGGGGGAEVLNR